MKKHHFAEGKKKNVKLAVIEFAIHNIGRDTAPESKNTAGKLDKVLNTDD